MSVDGAQLWTLNQRLLAVVMDACTQELAELGLETKEFFVLAEVEASPYPAEIATRCCYQGQRDGLRSQPRRQGLCPP